MDINVSVMQATGVEWLHGDESRGVFVQYRFYTDNKMRQTRAVHNMRVAKLEYNKQFTIRSVSSNFLNYLNTNALVLELWGKQGTGSLVESNTHRLIISRCVVIFFGIDYEPTYF